MLSRANLSQWQLSYERSVSNPARMSINKKRLHFERGAEQVQLRRTEFTVLKPDPTDLIRVRLPPNHCCLHTSTVKAQLPNSMAQPSRLAKAHTAGESCLLAMLRCL